MKHSAVAIYVLKDPRTEAIRYLGKSVDPEARLRSHLYVALTQLPRVRRDGHKERWLRQLDALRLRPLLEVVAEVPFGEWPDHERSWIARLRAEGHALTNVTAGGEGFDMPRTAEHSAKIGARHKGRKRTPDNIAKQVTSLQAANAQVCKNGHPRTPGNTVVSQTRGRTHRLCLECKQATAERTREKSNATQRARRAAAAGRSVNPPGRVSPPRSKRRSACKNGHLFVPGSYFEVRRKSGLLERGCKACRRAKDALRPRIPRTCPERTHCRNGHELTPHNTSFRLRDGVQRRECKACNRASHRRTKEKR